MERERECEGENGRGRRRRFHFDLVLVLLWSIWTDKNAYLWRGVAMNSIDIQCEAQAWLYEFKKWHGKHSCKKVSTPQKWRKLAAGWMKVNFDGAWDERHDQGGIGLVVRDVNGNFVVAMARHVGGIKSLTLAECMAAREVAPFARRWVGA
ncbi:hypothetical protein ACFX15_043482 [Malus domestica]